MNDKFCKCGNCGRVSIPQIRIDHVMSNDVSVENGIFTTNVKADSMIHTIKTPYCRHCGNPIDQVMDNVKFQRDFEIYQRNQIRKEHERIVREMERNQMVKEILIDFITLPYRFVRGFVNYIKTGNI